MTKYLVIAALFFLPFAAKAQTDLEGTKTQGEIRFGFNGSNYSDGRSSSVGEIDTTLRVSSTLELETVANGGAYFDEHFGGGGIYAIVNPDKSTYLRFGGFRNTVTNTTQVWGASAEAGTVLFRTNGFVKAVEGDAVWDTKGFSIQPSLGVSTYTGRFIFYLPKDWDVMLRAGAVSYKNNGVYQVQPSGGARLRIPVARRLEFTVSAGFDTEAITNILQAQSFSTRNIGAGAKVWLNRTTSVEAQGYHSYYTANNLTGNVYSVVLVRRF